MANITALSMERTQCDDFSGVGVQDGHLETNTGRTWVNHGMVYSLGISDYRWREKTSARAVRSHGNERVKIRPNEITDIPNCQLTNHCSFCVGMIVFRGPAGGSWARLCWGPEGRRLIIRMVHSASHTFKRITPHCRYRCPLSYLTRGKETHFTAE